MEHVAWMAIYRCTNHLAVWMSTLGFFFLSIYTLLDDEVVRGSLIGENTQFCYVTLFWNETNDFSCLFEGLLSKACKDFTQYDLKWLSYSASSVVHKWREYIQILKYLVTGWVASDPSIQAHTYWELRITCTYEEALDCCSSLLRVVHISRYLSWRQALVTAKSMLTQKPRWGTLTHPEPFIFSYSFNSVWRSFLYHDSGERGINDRHRILATK